MLFSSLVSFFALAAVGVDAHGYVKQIVANGKLYTGGVPGETNPASPIRSISTIDPYKDPKGAGITCGLNAKAGKMVAPVAAGSKITLQWIEHIKQLWPHEMGSMITYMAKVPAGQTADKVDPKNLDFFKIQQTGQKGKGQLKWFLEDQMKPNTDYTVNVPKNIPNGDYIMRHEIIALHLADKKGGAEFYTSCFQLKVSGGTGSGSPGPTAKFPGAYSATDPGIFTPKVFDKGFNYQFPGPAIPSFVAGASSNNVTNVSSSATPTKSTKSVKPTSTPVSGTVDPVDDDCEDDDQDPTVTESAPVPAPTDDDCTDEEPDVSEPATTTATKSATKSAKPTATGKTHNGYRRVQAAARGWGSRMERRFVGSSSS
ncbi:hypothetical protein FRC12_019668 [Ceratobasidium sp. 428]|nr:hypothetical protein FRC12_019668 [Ceratobasidium sp. 428]